MSLLLLFTELPTPVTPLSIDVVFEVPGPQDTFGASTFVTPKSVDINIEVPGPQPPVEPSTQFPVMPKSVDISFFVPGPQQYIAPPGVDGSETQGIGMLDAEANGVRDLTSANLHLVQNGNHTGSFSYVGSGPSAGAPVSMRVGNLYLSGYVAESDEPVTDDGEEGAEYQCNVEGYGRELTYGVVGTDLGAGETWRNGRPGQDVRHFNWVMNGAVTAENYPRVAETRDPLVAALDTNDKNRIALPDSWPDVRAQWMWPTEPGAAGIGWASFRRKWGWWKEQEFSFWMCSYDYAEFWLNGVQLLTCQQAGVAQNIRVVVDGGADEPGGQGGGYHLAAIRAHNGGGRAGVLFSAMPIYGDRLGNSELRSGAWQCASGDELATPLNVGQVIFHVWREARLRGNPFGSWQLMFSEDSDSNGVAWPKEKEGLTLDISMTYQDMLDRLAESYLDYYIDPSARRLFAVNKGDNLGAGGWGGGGTIPWTVGETLLSHRVEKRVW